MKILIVSATQFEVAPTLDFLNKNAQKKGAEFLLNKNSIQILVTGVGVPAVVYCLLKKFSKEDFDLVIQAGIAGTFSLNNSIGSVVEVVSDRFADIGVEEKNGNFTSVFEMELSNKNQFPYTNEWLENNTISEFMFLKKVIGVTVNKVSGTNTSIEKMRKKYPQAEIETMEGAAFHYVCLMEKKKFVHIRSISNLVEPRNKEKWNIKLAISQLNNVILKLIL